MRVRVTSSTLVALYTWGAGGIRGELGAQGLFPTLGLSSTGPKSSCPRKRMTSHSPQWRWQGLNPGESLMRGKRSSFHLGILGGDPGWGPMLWVIPTCSAGAGCSGPTEFPRPHRAFRAHRLLCLSLHVGGCGEGAEFLGLVSYPSPHH